MKLTSTTDVSNLKDINTIKIYISNTLFEIQKILNNNLDFETNFNNNIQIIEFLSINTDTKITHNLGRIPNGYIQYQNLDSPVIVYNGIQSWDTKVMYLKSNAIGRVKMVIF